MANLIRFINLKQGQQQSTRSQGGWSLLQVMVVLTIVGIMVTFGSGTYLQMSQTQEIRSTVAQLQREIQAAILVSMGAPGALEICAGQGPECSNDNWSQGYVLVAASDDAMTPKVLKRQESLSPFVSIQSPSKSIVVLPGGFVQETVEFTVCGQQLASEVYSLSVSQSGHVVITSETTPRTCDGVNA